MSAGGMRRRVTRIHMVGVAGAGMSGIAEVLVELGYAVSGSDLADGDVTERLRRAGVRIGPAGHDAGHVEGADVVVVSSAIAADNPEVMAARRAKIPVIRRAEMLAELMRARLGVAIAGAHGKTTTTSMIGSILAHAGMDPTVVVGGKLNAVGSNARLGASELMVVEADESDGSFLHLSPTVAVVTNLDAEHLDHYAGGLDEIRQAFRAFLGRLPFYGLAVLCGDHPEVQALGATLERRIVTYGFNPQVQLRAIDVRPDGPRCTFEVVGPEGSRGRHRLEMIGRHNVQNALAALAVAEELGVAPEVAREGLARFDGVDRRFSVRAEVAGVLVVDDYGHHPAEIAATLRGAREAWPDRRIVVVFQPHRFTRTEQLLEEFGSAFHEAERVFVSPVHPAGEAPIEGVDEGAVVDAMRRHGHRHAEALHELDEATSVVGEACRPGDLVIAFGAGSIGRWSAELTRHLRRNTVDGSD